MIEYLALILVSIIAVSAVWRVVSLERANNQLRRRVDDVVRENRRLQAAYIREKDKYRDILEADYIEEKA